MEFGRSITHRDSGPLSRPLSWRDSQRARQPALRGLAIAFGIAFASVVAQANPAAQSAQTCAKPVYLTFDTGHMGVAPLIADVLQRHQVRVTFFAANEPTREGDGSLGDHWAPWWRARASEGHEFASHTWDHMYWRADERDSGAQGGAKFRFRPSAGERKGIEFVGDTKDYCAQIERAAARLQAITGRAPLPLFRAPGGKTSAKLLASAKSCGWAHVGWADAGFLGDELSSEAHSNDALLRKALRDVRSGDILVAHLGIWSRKDPWAPAVLEPLITGLKAKGFCFATLRTHPAYTQWIAQSPAREPRK